MKGDKVYIVNGLFYVISILVIIYNLFSSSIVYIPEYISIIMASVIIGLNIYIWRKYNLKKYFKLVNTLVGIIVILILLFGTYCNPYWNSISFKNIKHISTKDRLDVLTYNEAREDVEYAVKYLRKVHPQFIKGIPTRINDKYKEILSDFKERDRISVEEVEYGIEEIFSLIEDEHTNVVGGTINTNISHIRERNEEFATYRIDDSNSLALLTLDSCVFNDTYKSMLKEMFTEIRNRNIKHIAIDLRNNGGGNSLVADEFIRYLNVDRYKTAKDEWRMGCFKLTFGGKEKNNKKKNELLFNGDVYVFTSNETFSSAMTFTEYIQANKLGTIIGESPGNAPNCYTDKITFVAPNSKLIVNISGKRRYAINSNMNSGLLQPDIVCKPEETMDKLMEIIK